MSGRHIIGLLLITALGAALRVGLAAYLYDGDLTNFSGGDYISYEDAARDLADGLPLDDRQFLSRPPLFPALIALLDMNPWAVLAANIVLGTALIPLSYLFARRLEAPSSVPWLTALFVALDPASLRYTGGVLLAEPLGVVLLLLMVLALREMLAARRGAWRWAMLAALLLNLSSLARPSAFLLWIPLGVWLLLVAGGRRGAVVLFMLASLLGVGAWMTHNAAQFDHATYSTIGTFNLLYYRALSVEHHATGQPLDAVYIDLAREVDARADNPPRAAYTPQTFEAHKNATPAESDAMQGLALDVIREHPAWYAGLTGLGAYRVLLWLDLPGEGFGVALLQALGLVGNLALLAGALAGLAVYWRAGRLWLFWLSVLLALYFIGGTLAVQSAGIDTRARVMLAPYMALAAALAWAHVRAQAV